MTLAILSDSHMPDSAERLPATFRDIIEDADRVVHAGDFGIDGAFGQIDSLASDLTAVYGNADPPDIDLPPVASVEYGGVTFVVTHGIVNHVKRAVTSSEGVVYNRDDWLQAIADVTRCRATKPRVGIGGHSHEVEDTVHEDIRLLNPGTSTGVADASPTMLTVEVSDGDVEVTTHEVEAATSDS